MTKIEMTENIMVAKKKSALSWEAIADEVGLGAVFITSACMGMNSLAAKPAEKLCALLGVDADVAEALQAYPNKSWEQIVPTDPLVYRLYEIMGVYGETIKAIVGEKFGDGIMSAIDFSLEIDKEENPAGDRVVITMNGKFLPYKSW